MIAWVGNLPAPLDRLFRRQGDRAWEPSVVEGITGLIERSDAERDQEVTALFNRHYTPLCRLAYVILGDAAAAEEVVMDALLKTFTGWRRIRDVDRADVYLRRSVINLCRSKIRRKVIEARVNALTHRRERPVPGWDPEQHETARAVWQAVGTLPPRQRACVVLFYFEDLPEAQIADVLECSIGTVKSQLSKARAKLERVLGTTIQSGSE